VKAQPHSHSAFAPASVPETHCSNAVHQPHDVLRAHDKHVVSREQLCATKRMNRKLDCDSTWKALANYEQTFRESLLANKNGAYQSNDGDETHFRGVFALSIQVRNPKIF
jgi:hypothetical protein